MTVEVRRAETDAERADALEVRRSVFVEEQGVPEDLEVDGKDDESIHFVAYAEGEGESERRDAADTDGLRPVGAGRLREVGEGVGKVERIAVLKPHRGEGVGGEIMRTLEATAAERGLSELVMHAQTPVEGFYRDLGYDTTSDEFEEAGIPHVEMTKSLE
ncbi:GNAT family N-acetyltransferase [Halorussus gelatinilyticus]|uniref:GNAT family N-acetyltransferase n=1 Tax=Halorussus gelatinilyticus TaxID=2937524 RepID=A0A8U0IG19_9EURY|nr:GNAT family N-acetyltransferase [Halorussus gelatinilyticus]UPW00037.1 GNAT family N-acetyltransferase [Halorussus gelatinilyticus]